MRASKPLFCVIPALLVCFVLVPFSSTAQDHKLTQLTFSDSTHDGYPYWSPDGAHILYCSGTRTSCFTYKIPSEGGSPELITDIFAQHARWSPDGKRIAFHSRGTIYILEPGTGNTSEFFSMEGKLAVPFDWSADGTFILADLRDTVDRTQSDLWLLHLDGSSRQLSFLEGRQVKPSLSPDGSMVLFTSYHGGNPDLWVMSLEGGEAVQLTFFEGGDSNPGFDVEASWSPDGRSIAFSSTRSEYWAIWKMDLDMDALKKSLF